MIIKRAKPGFRVSREYQSWLDMRKRCNNPRNHAFARYGGKGITVCARWDCFETLLSDMGHCPSREHSIDRIDNSKGYDPDNCRWADHRQQNQNKRNAVLTQEMADTIRALKKSGKTVSAIAEEIGVKRHNVASVLYNGIWEPCKGF